jgi:hypothetical protein
MSDDRFVVKMSPGDRLYLVGCNPVSGLDAVKEQPGAFSVDFKKSPSVTCPLGEESNFAVAIATKDY